MREGTHEDTIAHLERLQEENNDLREWAKSTDLEVWSERHFGELAFYRTVAAGVNILLSTIVIAKLFGWI